MWTSATTCRLRDPQFRDTIEEEARLDEILSLPKIDEMDSSDYLMGKEDCGKGDEECIKRRIISEAHLDYIYTQHDRP
ncbi:Phytosulfokine [Dillenia turbinata]|uniref:Phytosulfokine n=1 Tax=Dillenia turbinata TaxID=194707 RepID=A0AAN8VCA4_9MAGN